MLTLYIVSGKHYISPSNETSFLQFRARLLRRTRRPSMRTGVLECKESSNQHSRQTFIRTLPPVGRPWHQRQHAARPTECSVWCLCVRSLFSISKISRLRALASLAQRVQEARTRNVRVNYIWVRCPQRYQASAHMRKASVFGPVI